jgi:hypothetical protein
MTPKPIAIGLLLCDRVIVDKDTNSPSAIGIFTGLAVEHFPSDSQRFSVQWETPKSLITTSQRVILSPAFTSKRAMTGRIGRVVSIQSLPAR